MIMEKYSKQKVTIDLEEYNDLKAGKMKIRKKQS